MLICKKQVFYKVQTTGLTSMLSDNIAFKLFASAVSNCAFRRLEIVPGYICG